MCVIGVAGNGEDGGRGRFMVLLICCDGSGGLIWIRSMNVLSICPGVRR